MDYELYVDQEYIDSAGPEAAKLAQLMSDTSEECYCAGWMIGTEFRLWRAITDPTDDRCWGQDRIDDETVAHLRKLSEALGGWITWDDKKGAVFVPKDEWLRAYGCHAQRKEK